MGIYFRRLFNDHSTPVEIPSADTVVPSKPSTDTQADKQNTTPPPEEKVPDEHD